MIVRTSPLPLYAVIKVYMNFTCLLHISLMCHYFCYLLKGANLEVLLFPTSQVLGTVVNKPAFTLLFSALVYSSADEEITKRAIVKLT